MNTAEHALPLTPARHAARVALVQTTGVTLNGERAKICGARLPFPTVATLRGPLRAEYSWETVARVVATGGAFTA